MSRLKSVIPTRTATTATFRRNPELLFSRTVTTRNDVVRRRRTSALPLNTSRPHNSTRNWYA